MSSSLTETTLSASSPETPTSSPPTAGSPDYLILKTRPECVEAFRLTEENQRFLASFIGGWTFGVRALRWWDGDDDGHVVTLNAGDWAVRDGRGEWSICPDADLRYRFDRIIPAVGE